MNKNCAYCGLPLKEFHNSKYHIDCREKVRCHKKQNGTIKDKNPQEEKKAEKPKKKGPRGW